MLSEEALPAAGAAAIAGDLLGAVEFEEDIHRAVRPGVEAAAAALAAERGLSRAGRWRALAQLHDNLQRLRAVVRDRQRYPAIADGGISRPIFILGLPRCGTSLLHALMGADPDTRTPLMWEVAAPSPPPEADSFDTDPRIAAFDQYVTDTFTGQWADIRKAHPIGARIPQECGMILETAFCSANPVMLFRLPEFYEWYCRADTTFGYRVHRMWLQHLQWRTRRKRWVLKVQEHMYHLPELLSVYPDAVFIQPHRDPLTVMASISRLIQVIRSVSFDDLDPVELGREMLHLWHDGQVRMMAYRKAHPDLRVYDMRYRDLAEDPVAEVRRVYGFYDMPFTPSAEAGMRRWLAENPADKHGRHQYRLEDFGLTEAQVRDVYADYIETYRDYL